MIKMVNFMCILPQLKRHNNKKMTVSLQFTYVPSLTKQFY